MKSSNASNSSALFPPASWGDPEATGEESLKHHGNINLRYQTVLDPDAQDESTQDTRDPDQRIVTGSGERETFRLQLRRKVLCGTRLFL